MLECSCGWKGIDLVPNKADNTSRCPKCRSVFKGIPASSAILDIFKAAVFERDGGK